MTRPILLLALLAGVASGQTYVRPSKGTPLTPFTSTSWAGAPLITNPPPANVQAFSPPYDWSAFEAVRIRVYGTGTFSWLGETCSNLTKQYTVSDIGSFMRMWLRIEGYSVRLTVQDAPAPTGPWLSMQTQNATVTLTEFIGCNLNVQLTPLPFAQGIVYPASPDGGYFVPVVISGTVSVGPTTDAGLNITVPYCTATRSSSVSVGTSVVTVPADGGLAGRWMVRVCNSPRNSGVPIITCATGGATPDAGLLADGEALEVGDCASYTTGGAVTCISDTAATAVSTWECR